jgi:hypothetical protein
LAHLAKAAELSAQAHAVTVLADGQELLTVDCDTKHSIGDQRRFVGVSTADRANVLKLGTPCDGARVEEIFSGGRRPWKGWVNPPHDFDKYDGIKKNGEKE